jgi:hypothetical protein
MLESTESVTRLPHETPGEVLVSQIDERYLNKPRLAKARHVNARKNCVARAFNSSRSRVAKARRSGIRIKPSCVRSFISRFDAIQRNIAREIPSPALAALTATRDRRVVADMTLIKTTFDEDAACGTPSLEVRALVLLA